MARLTNSPNEYHVFQLEQRKSFAFQVLLCRPVDRPVDLTGSAISMTVGKTVDPTKPPETVIEKAAVLNDDPTTGLCTIPLQAEDLDLDVGAYDFVIVLRAGGYSLVLVKGKIEVVSNPEMDSVDDQYSAMAAPEAALMVQLRDNQVIKVHVPSSLPPRAGDGLDAAGLAEGLMPLSSGDGSWAWGQPTHLESLHVEGALEVEDDLDVWGRTYLLNGVAVWEYSGFMDSVQIGGDLEVVGSLTYGIPNMPSGVDLDDMTTTGKWFQNFPSQATLINNYPVASGTGMLEVEMISPSLGWQTYTLVGGKEVYKRWHDSFGGWSGWTLYFSGTKTDWVDVPITNATNFELWGSASTTGIRYRTDGDWIELTGEVRSMIAGAIDGTTSDKRHEIAKLPEEVAPPRRIISIHQGSGLNHWSSHVEPNGSLEATRYGPGSSGSNTWLPFYINYKFR